MMFRSLLIKCTQSPTPWTLTHPSAVKGTVSRAAGYKQRDFNTAVNVTTMPPRKEIAVFKHGSDKDRTCLESHSRDIFFCDL